MKKALIIQRFFLLVVRREQFQQRVEEQFALLGDLPVLRGFFQIAFGQRFVQLRANDAFRQPGVVDEVMRGAASSRRKRFMKNSNGRSAAATSCCLSM